MRALLGKVLRLSAGLALAMPTLGCAPARLLNALITEDGYRVERDIAYADAPRQRLDIYVPDAVTPGAKVAIFFYGGRWEYGSKVDYRFVGQALASRGIITVIADYRLYPDVRFPGFVEDGAKAVGWVRRYIAERGGDPESIYLVGHSAGAHIAAMLALNPRFLAAEGVRVLDLGGLIGLAGPYEFLPIKDPVIKEIFAVDNLEATQPITYASRQAPSTLLLTGDVDETVLPRNSARLGEAISHAGGGAEVKVYQRIGHIGILLALASPVRWLAPTLDDIVAFIRSAPRSNRRAA
ncbi:MAG: alpha/beta hydrolase [Alphaproteobacteria bacterium]|nr:alpha/beta hydrolase [Alphaproteobacteria bacterium]